MEHYRFSPHITRFEMIEMILNTIREKMSTVQMTFYDLCLLLCSVLVITIFQRENKMWHEKCGVLLRVWQLQTLCKMMLDATPTRRKITRTPRPKILVILYTRGPHSVQEVPDRVRPGRQFAIISRKTFALPAKQTPYTCPMRRALIINAFIPPSHFCQNRPKMTSHEFLQKSDGTIEIER
ncbi:hypothetical protein OUZ56_001115 [Daphnia magna]|uniref:Uncharacterized protein n=1 Tax=Daphnia magna TaxID=35525 RepID=A0ABR0A1P3_9CRUS|nr:hypothetical protein OUZ56_001115 [Daphnia magna]